MRSRIPMFGKNKTCRLLTKPARNKRSESEKVSRHAYTELHQKLKLKSRLAVFYMHF